MSESENYVSGRHIKFRGIETFRKMKSDIERITNKFKCLKKAFKLDERKKKEKIIQHFRKQKLW